MATGAGATTDVSIAAAEQAATEAKHFSEAKTETKKVR
jgi:hypothetical protein